MESIQTVWADVDNLQATKEDYRDYKRQLKFYWPDDWVQAYKKGTGGAWPF